jgi:PKD repeat protein
MLVTLALVFSTVAAPVTVLGAGQDDIDNSVEDGLSWLASQQNLDGSWNSSDQVGYTALIVTAFNQHAIRNGTDPLGASYQYRTVVQKGLDYIFSRAVITAISVQPYGDPDANGNGNGVYFFGSGSHHANYETGCALMAIASSKAPSRTVGSGPLSGMSYRDVAQDVLDYLAYMQRDGSTGRGGWYYSPSDNGSGGSDNSIAGWVALGLGYAHAAAPYGFGLTIPQFVLDELNIWIDYIQNDVDGDQMDGGSGYGQPDSWVNSYKTGHLIYQMHLVGDTAQTGRVRDAVDYIVRHWNDDNGSFDHTGWRASGVPHLIATAAMMKGFVVMGIDRIDGIDWFDEFAGAILANQNSNGSWDGQNWATDLLSTAWALITLQKAAGVAVLTAPKADFTAQPRFGPAKLTVRFTDLSQGDITAWRWNFGDGTTSSARNSTHTYTQRGTYTVKLTVTGPGGSDTMVKEQYVRVTSSSEKDVPEPADLGVSYLNIDPAQVLPNQEVTISANICNSGEERGTKTVSLMVSGEAVASQSVGVSGGSCQQVVFKTSRAIPGTYQVAIDGMTGQFSVLAPRTVTNNVPSQQQTGLGTAGIIAIIAVIIVLIAALIMVFRRT